ncbi:MAG TPA: GIY-YIG nuclease family protein [Spirochaetota bacterium]|nr:GIY-YIG nuclease family protein [Spirochaetota bacterium]
MPLKNYIVYILRCADYTLYTGITVDTKARLKKHACGRGSKYVRARLPAEIVYTRKVRGRSRASREECRIKKMSRQEKLNLISSNNLK